MKKQKNIIIEETKKASTLKNYEIPEDTLKKLLSEKDYKNVCEAKKITKELIVDHDKKASERAQAITNKKKDMILTTCPTIANYRITKTIGLVSGEVVFKAGLLKGLDAMVENFFDSFSIYETEMTGSMELLKRAKEYSADKMKEEAAQKGGNAIVGVDCESSFGGDIMHITYNGTAVVIEKIEEN